MKIQFHFPTQGGATASWLPSKPPKSPITCTTDYPGQVLTQTAGGVMYVQDKGLQRKTFELEFERLNRAERDQALAFFNTVKKSFQAFEFIDLEGTTHGVRWINPFEFLETVDGRYSGTIQLIQDS